MSAPDVVVRLARPSDLRRLAAIEDSGLAAFEAHFGGAMVPALSTPAPSGSERDGDGFLLVATIGRALVGFVHVIDLDGSAHLEQVSVLPEHGRVGVGTRLVRAAMEEARWSGYHRMSLCTYRDVPWNGPFYARLGFAEVHDLEPYQARLRAHEQALGLDDPGARLVMSTPLERQVTGQ